MKIRHPFLKVLFVILLIGVQFTYAAFTLTGLTDEKSKSAKYSLRNLSNLSSRNLSFSTLRLTLPLKGVQNYTSTRPGSMLESNSMMRYGYGNTTYIYNYHVVIKAPKFKTPSPDYR
jgi:hypothetical protein